MCQYYLVQNKESGLEFIGVVFLLSLIHVVSRVAAFPNAETEGLCSFLFYVLLIFICDCLFFFIYKQLRCGCSMWTISLSELDITR